MEIPVKDCIVGLLLTRPITLLSMVLWVVGELSVHLCGVAALISTWVV